MNGFLLDTNVPSELVRPRPEQRVVEWVEAQNDDYVFASVITIGEIRKGLTANRDPSNELFSSTGFKPIFFLGSKVEFCR